MAALSRKRAEVIVDALVERGVARDRLTARVEVEDVATAAAETASHRISFVPSGGTANPDDAAKEADLLARRPDPKSQRRMLDPIVKATTSTSAAMPTTRDAAC